MSRVRIASPALKENESDRQVVSAVEAWKHADFLYKNYILNGLDNALYNVYIFCQKKHIYILLYISRSKYYIYIRRDEAKKTGILNTRLVFFCNI